jgi:predicted metal-dependent phosphoesterase TrpH
VDEIKGLIDLHIHTTASDGTLTPEETVFHAAEKGLKAIAITDHDTVDGIAEALKAGNKTGVEVVPGVEISVDHIGEIHILGYYIDYESPEFMEKMAMLQQYRNMRNLQMIEKLRRLGFNLTMEEVELEAGNGLVGRPHFAAVMVNKGYVKNFNEAFERYIGAGRPAYVKKEKLTPREGIEMIAVAGGIPVLAHPKYVKLNGYDGLESLIKELKGYGLRGIEAIYTKHTAEETRRFCKMAKRTGLLITGGSDFHGGNKPDTEIGKGDGSLSIGYGILEELSKAKSMQKTSG